MKKRFVALLALLGLTSLPISSVFATAEDAPIVYNHYEIELSEEKAYAPAILSEAYFYTAKLYEYADEELSNPVCDSFHEDGYQFTASGRYRVQYFLTEKSTLVETQVSSILQVVDTTPPSFVLKGAYAEYYERNDEVTLLEGVASDNAAQKPTYVIGVTANGVSVTNQIQEGKLTVSSLGEYKIIYTVTDYSGNVREFTYGFTAVEEENTPTSSASDRNGKGCGSLIGCASGVGAAFIGLVVCLGKRRGAK